MQDFFQVKVFAPRLKLRLLSSSSCIQFSSTRSCYIFRSHFIHLAGGQYFRISSSFSLLILAKRSKLNFFTLLIPLVDHFNFDRINQNPLKKSLYRSLKLKRCQRLTSVNQQDFKWLPNGLKTLFYIFKKVPFSYF